MNVLITGVSGFIGSHLAERLLKEGFNVYGIIRVVYTLRLIDVPEGVKTIHADLLDLHSLRKAIRLSQPDYIFHLAAVSPVMYSFENPLLYANTNFIGTCNLVEAILSLNQAVERLIVASTAEVYGEQGKEVYVEEDPPSARNTPYGVSKVAMDYWVRMCGDVYGLPYTINRSSNMYGPRTRQRVTEKIIQTMLTSKVLKMDGRPDVVRDFMYIKDGVEGYLACMKPQAENEVFNFGTGKGTSIAELVEVCKRVIDWSGEVHFAQAPRPTDPSRLVLSYKKAERILGWKPKYSLEEGIKETVAWWRKQLDKV